MRDPKYQGRGSPDTTYGKRFDAVKEVPEPPTLSDMIRQRQRDRTKLQDKRSVRRERI